MYDIHSEQGIVLFHGEAVFFISGTFCFCCYPVTSMEAGKKGSKE